MMTSSALWTTLMFPRKCLALFSRHCPGIRPVVSIMGRSCSRSSKRFRLQERSHGWKRKTYSWSCQVAPALEKLRKEYPTKSKDEISAIITQNLNTVCGIAPYQSSVPKSTEQFSFYGASLSYHVALHRTTPGQLVILNA